MRKFRLSLSLLNLKLSKSECILRILYISILNNMIHNSVFAYVIIRRNNMIFNSIGHKFKEMVSSFIQCINDFYEMYSGADWQKL
jgi:hypothetical protein